MADQTSPLWTLCHFVCERTSVDSTALVFQTDSLKILYFDDGFSGAPTEFGCKHR